jgi:ATP-dependent exoDNAse (exonuclease V) beta subunit
MTKPPADQAERTRFTSELDRNFSVLAPAGVGKTKSLVDRVVAIATSPQASEWLPRLVVVTYTKKAADEMYQRARNAIIERRVGLPVLTQFNHAFFGTLHSFCVRLLRTHGHLCGLPAQFEPVEDDGELWQEFIGQTDRLAPKLHPDQMAQILRLVDMDTLLNLARSLPADALPNAFDALSPPPGVELKWVLGFEGGKSKSDTIPRSQRAAREWQETWLSGSGFAPLPKSASKAKEFWACWENAFAPLRKWMGPASLRVAAELARAYQDYRRQRGALTFADQVELAWELLRDPGASRSLRDQGFRIILDEAQDTDPLQFNILLELARPATATGLWMETGGAAPEPGRYCMVGDPQQSIYGQRADLAHYESVRKKLDQADAAEELTFTVTFRCDQAIIAGVNELVQPMFGRTEGQVDYTPLTARPEVGPGQVVRWCPATPPGEMTTVEPKTMHEARQLAEWLKNLGPGGLGADSWSEVAILAPRTRWLQVLSTALQRAGLLPQVHSERSVQADDPVYAWFTALLHILAQPDDGFEIVGVLRELYGLSDEALALHANGDGAVWNLATPVEPVNEVTRVLHALGRLHAEIQPLPIREAARRAVEQTTLLERLGAIPGLGDEVSTRLDVLLTLAGQAEADGLSLAEFAEQLRDGMEAGAPARPVQPDAIQLLTCHKAKGLQWDAVVIPLMFRPISPVNNYPVLLRTRPGEQPAVAFSSDDLGDSADQVALKVRQEMQRLLYVALTRARRTLVLADDYAIFPAKKPNRSFADLLGLMDTEGKLIFNETWNRWDAAPTQPARPHEAVAELDTPAWPPITTAELTAARQHAQAVPSRVLPYQLGEALARSERSLSEPEVERSVGAEAARAYGIWWHETIEHLDWADGRAAWEAAWQKALPVCPQPDRGAREGEALFASPLAQRLSGPALVRHREMPILWRRSADDCVEGIVDLAVWFAADRRWLIVDWKTNLIAPDGHAHLRDIYEPQLRAYAEALHELSGASVEAGVHSTVTGGWVPCAELP